MYKEGNVPEYFFDRWAPFSLSAFSTLFPSFLGHNFLPLSKFFLFSFAYFLFSSFLFLYLFRFFLFSFFHSFFLSFLLCTFSRLPLKLRMVNPLMVIFMAVISNCVGNFLWIIKKYSCFKFTKRCLAHKTMPLHNKLEGVGNKFDDYTQAGTHYTEKRWTIFPSPAGMSQTKLLLAGNNL